MYFCPQMKFDFMQESIHEQYMQRCLDLARMGEGLVAPNPMVGSVIVCNNKVIGEGFHRQWGGPHAEVNAIASVKNQELLKDSTIYVNLEPCSHHGKTPPCADLILSTGIREVVIGTVDPNSLVAGKGIEKLKNGGCKITMDILDEGCRWLNRRFFTFYQKNRPYIILKWAQTNDGFVDTERSSEEFGKPTWITNEMARIAVHKQRANEQAILVGSITAVKDNPSLTLRDWFGRQPLRIVMDRKNIVSHNAHLFDGTCPTLVLTGCQNFKTTDNTDFLVLHESDDPLEPLLHELYQRGIQSLIVEGGPSLQQTFIDKHLWDEANVYIGNVSFGQGIKAAIPDSVPIASESIGNSKLYRYLKH